MHHLLTRLRFIRAALLILVISVLSACSSDQSITKDDPAFAELPPAIVAEVLASKSAQERAKSPTVEAERALWQGIMLNFVQTREAYTIYETWRTTGEPPKVAADIKVKTPLAAYPDYVRAKDSLREMVSGGDIEQLRMLLTNQSAGGAWIPVKAGDEKGLSISDAVKGGK